MSVPTLDSFLAAHSLSIGDRVAVQWKEMRVEGIILPQPGTSVFLNLKLSSGYNTGLSLPLIKSVEKLSPATPAPARSTPIPPSHAPTTPGISLITAGGTIGSKVDYKTSGVNALMTPDELLALVPEIGSFAHFYSVISPFSKLSENMNSHDWIQLAQICHAELQKPEVKGVLLTHGTDTLHYTAAALAFMLRDMSKPVVLVGAQRSSDRGSSDAPFNLICASHVALSNVAEVGICMHGTTSDDYCLFTRGTRVRKMHTSRRDAFRPINDIPIAKVFPEGKVEFFNHHTPRDEARTSTLDAVFDPNVALIKTYPGMPAHVLEHMAEKGCTGFILEGTGLGGIDSEWFPVLKKITDKHIPVFFTSQTIYGRANLNVYSNGRLLQQAGVVGLEDMLPEVAYVKLGWVLGHTKDLAKVKEMMHTNYAGEISPTSRVDAFLN